jgi:hypothetical protein
MQKGMKTQGNLESLRPVGSEAIVDEDDGQTEGSFGRMIAKVTCGDKVPNEELLIQGHTELITSLCDESEFADEKWAKEGGC